MKTARLALTIGLVLIFVLQSGGASSASDVQGYSINLDSSAPYPEGTCVGTFIGQAVLNGPQDWVGFWPQGAHPSNADGVYEYLLGFTDELNYDVYVQTVSCTLTGAILECLTQTTTHSDAEIASCVQELLDAPDFDVKASTDPLYAELPFEVALNSDPLPDWAFEVTGGEALYVASWPSALNYAVH